MATFPELEPNTRSYDFGLFPLTEEPSLSAGIVRFRHSISPQNYQLTLGYNAITDAQATLIRNHYQGQGGGYRSFLLPAVIWKGHTSSDNIVSAEMLWRYSETPEEEHLAVGRINVTIALVSDGVIPPVEAPGFTGGITATIAAGAGVATNEAPGFTGVVTASIAGGAATTPPPSDPNFSNVVVLLHMNGADESTTIVNSAPTGFSISNSGSNCKIDTAQSKFGGASCRPGSGMQTTSDSSPRYLTNPFTQEAWIYVGQHGTRREIVRIGTTDPGIYITAAGLLVVEVGSPGNIVITGASVTTNTWHHVALCRGFPSANDHRLYLNGVQTGGTWTNPYSISSSTFIYLSSTGFAGNTNQWIDEVRVTKGVCRYTGTFTPPTAPFPDS